MLRIRIITPKVQTRFDSRGYKVEQKVEDMAYKEEIFIAPDQAPIGDFMSVLHVVCIFVQNLWQRLTCDCGSVLVQICKFLLNINTFSHVFTVPTRDFP